MKKQSIMGNIRLKKGNSILGVLLFVCSIILLTNCKSDDSDDKNDQKGEKDEVCLNVEHDGFRSLEQASQVREYILHVPSSYNSDVPAALIINFHGFGGCAADFAMDIGTSFSLNELADTENFIVAYPQGVVREKEGAEWDPGDSGVDNIIDNDVYFVEQLIADIGSDYSVDESRIYATGYSNGGMMAYGLACNRSNIIAAVGIMSGVMLSDECDVAGSTSIIHFHGIGDDVLPFDGNGDFQSIPDIVNFWLDHNSIPSASLVSTSLNGGDVVRDEYSGGSENTSLVLYTINSEFGKEGGHVWFSGEIDGATPNEILWDFLSAYSL